MLRVLYGNMAWKRVGETNLAQGEGRMYTCTQFCVGDIKASSCGIFLYHSNHLLGVVLLKHTLFGMSTINRIIKSINNPLHDTYVYLQDLFLGLKIY